MNNDDSITISTKVSFNPSDLIYLKADVNYTIFFFKDGEKIIISKTLKYVEYILSNFHFIRIHRAFLVNRDHITSVKGTKLRMYVCLNGTIDLLVSRRKTNMVRRKI
jgi:two-component system LytT family response regulator